MPFRDRRDAGRRLADRVAALPLAQPVILGLPRGGVPVAGEIARVLDAPLDVLVVRKLGCPGQPELGIGAIGELDDARTVRLANDALVDQVGVSPAELDDIAAREEQELRRRVVRYRGDRPRVEVRQRDVVLVDDGLATGFTARAGVAVLREQAAAKVVVAVPVAPPETARELAIIADVLVCLETPSAFWGVGQWYDDFSQVTDEEVTALLAGSRPKTS